MLIGRPRVHWQPQMSDSMRLILDLLSCATAPAAGRRFAAAAQKPPAPPCPAPPPLPAAAAAAPAAGTSTAAAAATQAAQPASRPSNCAPIATHRSDAFERAYCRAEGFEPYKLSTLK